MNEQQWTVPDLLQLSGGYWAACALHAGVKLNLFTILDSAPLSSQEAASQAGTDPRGTGLLLDALASLNLLEKNGDRYVATSFAAKALSKGSAEYMGHIIMHHHHLMHGWSQLHEAVTSGAPVRENSSHDDDETRRESFLMGMFNMAALLAPARAAAIDLSACRSLLDLGGGPGTYAIHFCLANPALKATVYDLPTTRQFAEKTIDRFGLAERIDFVEGDFHSDEIPTGFDAVWISHILHSDGPESCARLLDRAVKVLNPGGILMVQEFILNDDKAGPVFPALFSLNMLIGTERGQSYSAAELQQMLTNAGLAGVHRPPVDLPNGAGVVMGRKAEV